jgi:hypothetical protein
MGSGFFDHLTSGKSLIVSGNFLESDARPVEMLLFVIFLVIAAWTLSSLLAAGLEALFDRMGDRGRLQGIVSRRMPLATGFQKRREALIENLQGHTERLKDAIGLRNNLKLKLKKLASARNQLVRQIGEPGENTNCYSFVVANRYVMTYVAKDQQHPLLDNSWHTGQLVEVWAPSLLDAQLQVVDRYPASAGYFVEATAPAGGAKKGAAR